MSPFKPYLKPLPPPRVYSAVLAPPRFFFLDRRNPFLSQSVCIFHLSYIMLFTIMFPWLVPFHSLDLSSNPTSLERTFLTTVSKFGSLQLYTINSFFPNFYHYLQTFCLLRIFPLRIKFLKVGIDSQNIELTPLRD